MAAAQLQPAGEAIGSSPAEAAAPHSPPNARTVVAAGEAAAGVSMAAEPVAAAEAEDRPAVAVAAAAEAAASAAEDVPPADSIWETLLGADMCAALPDSSSVASLVAAEPDAAQVGGCEAAAGAAAAGKEDDGETSALP